MPDAALGGLAPGDVAALLAAVFVAGDRAERAGHRPVQLAGPDPVARVRADSIVFLTLNGALLPLMAVQGMLPWSTALLGLLLFAPYGIGARAGQALFVPRWEPWYRSAVYAIVAAAVLVGLPLWS